MAVASFYTLAALTLGGSCREREPAPAPAPPTPGQETMAVSLLVVENIEIEARLERADGEYLHQETIRIVVTLRNRDTTEREIPYLVSHTLALELRNAGGGETRTGERRFQPPGPLMNMPEPEVPLAPREEVMYRVPLDLALGVVPPGVYQVRLVVESPPLPFTTEWLPLKVAGPRVAVPRSAPSSTSEARELRTVWRDDGVEPRQILLQVRTLRDRPLLVEGRRLGYADSLSEPAVAEAPIGVDPVPVWVAWVAGGRLLLARSRGEMVTTQDYPLPQGQFRVAHPWVFSESPDGTGTILHGVLVDDAGHRLHAFSGDGVTMRVAPGVAAGPGRIVSIATAPMDSRRLAVVLARIEGGRTAIEAWTFDLGAPTGPLPLATIEGGIEAIAIHSIPDGRTLWAVTQRAGDGSSMRVIEGVFAGAGPDPRRTPPDVREIAGGQGVWTGDAGIDEQHRLWLLRVDAAGVKVFGPGAERGIVVDVPPGLRFATLIFRRGELPQVLGLDPQAGFVAIPVDLSRGEPRQEDEEDEEDDAEG